jgi:hypothetical protein
MSSSKAKPQQGGGGDRNQPSELQARRFTTDKTRVELYLSDFDARDFACSLDLAAQCASRVVNQNSHITARRHVRVQNHLSLAVVIKPQSVVIRNRREKQFLAAPNFQIRSQSIPSTRPETINRTISSKNSSQKIHLVIFTSPHFREQRDGLKYDLLQRNHVTMRV